jgi:hypothetical protein
MTTVAFSNGVMASDSMAVGYCKFNSGPKITEFFSANDIIDSSQELKRKKYLIGCAGPSSSIKKFLKYFMEENLNPNYVCKLESIPEVDEDFCALVYDGENLQYYDDHLVGVKVPNLYAIGSGAQYALGALYSGKNAEEAVNVAIMLDTYSGGNVHTFTY